MGWILIHTEDEMPSSFPITDSELLSTNVICLHSCKDADEFDPFFRFTKKIQPCIDSILDKDEE